MRYQCQYISLIVYIIYLIIIINNLLSVYIYISIRLILRMALLTLTYYYT